jgi:hypothetical protein
MKKGFMSMIVFILMTGTSGSAYTYKGRVIDAGTREPIEGAAVVVYWYEEKAVLAGSHEKLKDVKETLTDENGEWKIKGPKGRTDVNLLIGIVSFLPFVYYTLAPNFIIFKPGYCSWPKGFGISACRGGLEPTGHNRIREGATVELPKLTNREDRLKSKPGIVKGDIGAKRKQLAKRKQKTYIKLLNEEKRYLGVGEYRYDFLKEDNK